MLDLPVRHDGDTRRIECGLGFNPRDKQSLRELAYAVTKAAWSHEKDAVVPHVVRHNAPFATFRESADVTHDESLPLGRIEVTLKDDQG